jgi:hypothetical protein
LVLWRRGKAYFLDSNGATTYFNAAFAEVGRPVDWSRWPSNR